MVMKSIYVFGRWNLDMLNSSGWWTWYLPIFSEDKERRYNEYVTNTNERYRSTEVEEQVLLFCK